MLGILVPEVEGAVTARSAKGAVDRVEGYRVNSIDVDVVCRWRVPVAFEGEVGTGGV